MTDTITLIDATAYDFKSWARDFARDHNLTGPLPSSPENVLIFVTSILVPYRRDVLRTKDAHRDIIPEVARRAGYDTIHYGIEYRFVPRDDAVKID